MIKIYKDRIIEINHSKKSRKIPDNQFFMYLGDGVQLDDKVTFERIMNLLIINKKLTNIIFFNTLAGNDIQIFYDEMIGPVDKDNTIDPKKDHLEVYSHPDIWKFKKSEKRLEYSEVYSIHIKKKGERIPYGLSFVKLSNFKKLSIKIRHNIDVCINDTTVKITKDSLKPVLLLKSESFRLFDFIWSVLYEIAWHGNPKERDARADKIFNTTYDPKDMIPHKDVMKMLKNRLKNYKKK